MTALVGGEEDVQNNAAAKGPPADAQHLIVIRHGDRWDYENPTAWKNHAYARKGDPSLSSLGHEQAREVGRHLNSLFLDLKISAEDITWMSSPFLRTLQTSTEALRCLTLEGSKKIPILPEDGVFEWDAGGGEWHACLPDVKERAHYFPRLLETATTYTPLYVPPLPEPRSEFQGRCQITMNAMHKRHAYKSKSVLVVVTHAACCIGLVAAASGKTSAEVTPAAPCSIYQLARWNNDPVWHLDQHDAPNSKNGYTEHMSSLGSHTIPWNHFGDKTRNRGYTGPPNSRFAPKAPKEDS